MHTHSSKKILLWIQAMILSVGIHAQEPDPGPPPVDGDGPGDPDQEVPFDGGLSLLLAAGAAYGAKKSFDYRKGMKLKTNTMI
jgi:hypothetical protein